MNSSINIDEALEKRIKAHLVGKESISLFVYRAVIEKVNRMEKRNERAVKQIFDKDVETLLPIMKECLKQLGVLK
jgi:hypothetical protein